MSIRVIGLVSVVLAMLAACATTPETVADSDEVAQELVDPSETAQASAIEPGDPDEVICKRVQKTGTRFKEKVCATREQWANSEQYGRDTTRELQSRPIKGPNNQ